MQSVLHYFYMAMKKEKIVAGNPLVYVTRDIERALGQKPTGSYFILANRTPYTESVRAKHPDNIFLIENKNKNGDVSDGLLDTFDVLKAGEKIIEKIAAKNSSGEKNVVDILVFKNTSRIEEFCAQKKWHLLNPPAALAEKIENKITQEKTVGKAAAHFPPHFTAKVSDILLKNSDVSAPFMLQWAHAHTGEGTIFISADKNGEKILAALHEKFPNREARVTNYVNGPIFTANVCVMPAGASAGKNGILIGNISTQITGMLPFTDNPWTTVGNDWSLPHGILDENRLARFNEIACEVGEELQKKGWRGLFGIDCIYDIERDNLHLIEVNARQPASTTYESQLQENIRELAPDHFKNCATIFEAHIAALRDTKTSDKSAGLIEINDGAQIILRIPTIAELRKTNEEIAEISAELRVQKYIVIEYLNTKSGSDLLRIQSDRGIMESQNKFNARGKEILEIVTGVEEKHDIM